MTRFFTFQGVWLANGILFAESRAARSVRRTQVEYVAPAQTHWWQIVLLLLLLGGIAYALHRWREPLKRIVFHNPVWLFLQLCRQHQLEWGNCWLLCRIAIAQKLRNPARIFVTPASLSPQLLGPAWEADAARLEALRERLFSVASEKISPAQPAA